MSEANNRLERMRNLVLALIVVIVVVASAAPVIVRSYLDQQIDEVQLAIDCSSARWNRQQLIALAEISDRLGLPREFAPEPLPEECR